MKFYIIDNESLYTEIIEPLGHKAKERNEEFVVAYNTVIKIESGTIQNPTIETLAKIAKALDVKVDDLIKK